MFKHSLVKMEEKYSLNTVAMSLSGMGSPLSVRSWMAELLFFGETRFQNFLGLLLKMDSKSLKKNLFLACFMLLV